MKYLFAIVIVSVMVLPGCLAEQSPDTQQIDSRRGDMEVMRKRRIDFLTGQLGDTSGSRRADAVEQMDARVESLLSKIWPVAKFTDADAKNLEDLDKNIVNQSQYTIEVTKHLTDLVQLATAHETPGSKYYHDEALQLMIRIQLQIALLWMTPESPKPGYWSSWTFRISQATCETALLVDSYIDPQTKEKLIAGMNWLMEDMTLSGVNAVWEGRNHFMFGLLTYDADRIDMVMSRVEPQLQYRDESGVMEDYAYQFHGKIVYTGAYGAGYSQAVSQFLFFTDGTSWEIAKPRREVMINYLLNHAQWTSIGGSYDISVAGRTYKSRRNNIPLVEAMIYMSYVDSKQQQEIRQVASRLIGKHPAMGISIAPMADEIAGQPAEALQGFRYYHTSDYAIFRNADFYTSVRMHSKRMQDYEYLGYGGGIEGYNLANGFTYITRSGKEWWGKSNAMNSLDYERLPGTTARIDVHPAEPFNYGESNFSGGAGTAEAGIVGFKQIPPAGDFVALKSYFFFDQGFVALGSGISSTAAHDKPVNTTVTQWASPAADSPLHISGRDEPITSDTQEIVKGVTWAWCDDVGYIFPKAVELNVRRVGVLTTLWLDHTNNPQGAKYAYMVLPDSSLAATQEFALNPPISIVEHNEKAHVVRNNIKQATGMVLWKAGSAGLVTTDRPAVIFQQASHSGVVLTIQNPLHTQQRMNVLVDHTGPVTSKHDEVSVVAKGKETLLQVNTAIGRQYCVALGDIGQEVYKPARENMLDFYDFKVSAESDEKLTYLTVQLPQEVIESEYRLTVHGYKGHYMYQLTEDDIVDRIDEKTIKFCWDRFAGEPRQTFGSFRMQIHTPLKGATAYFSIPRYAEKDEDLMGRNYDLDRNRPPGE